jgi:Raf kinase inhibitor-like YbhB/YbcL family protein
MSEHITVASDAFAEGQKIPAAHTCDGQDLSPRIMIFDLPPGTKTWAILCDDPDAPGGDWVHWLAFNLPPSLTELAQGVPPEALAKLGGATGRNSWGNSRYQGPCPPSGSHRYFFKVFALDCALELPSGTSKADFLAKSKGHALAHGMLMGRYERQR